MMKLIMPRKPLLILIAIPTKLTFELLYISVDCLVAFQKLFRRECHETNIADVGSFLHLYL